MAQAKKSKTPAPKSKPAKTARKPTKRTPALAAPHRSGTKQAQMIELLSRETGATIADLVAATSWLPHTIRGAMAGALKKKLGLTITSEKLEGRGRVYRVQPK
ncbi:MAG: hypothetical protein B7Y80_03030 [Hyphomicrobium sp. 32-62-53]|nr:MAG: hypothetical protein B7Z29_07240 [Hyphomicrobium sp. 12-62-95]OYY00906.1 MAG: hypothetical protein B7Y80_03030 [Hyphomicrobium sp. 32-62-53]